MSVSDKKMDDFGFIITKSYIELSTKLKQLDGAVEGVNTFYIHETPKDEIIYQYNPKYQTDFRKRARVISRELDAVTPVLKEINEILRIDKETLQPSTGMPQPSQQINISQPPQQQPSMFQNMIRRFGMGDTLPRSIEDAWNITKGMVLETMNIPNIWRKILDWHEKGLLHVHIFPQGGHTQYLAIEVFYFNAIISPNIMPLVERGYKLLETKRMQTIQETMGRSMEHKEKIMAQLAFSGQPPPNQ